ncbi:MULTISPECIES: hypothetical protein [unclassified Nocardioides]|uniref:hypothetical protein n=1 Tax=unclassified Nocardioides TaxID=2615069 RepID=UPI0000570F99|nr:MULTISPECIES: hypothetical protein [unclassified Nocardioides]ABL84154.1 hypothetical protein Noca_4659 [Nocardioides sp. JS614]
MKPLQSIAMGLVIIAIAARIGGGYDVLPDPVGWLLVLQGLGQLPASLPHRPALSTLGFLALLMSIVLWFPDLADGLERTDESLLWAANLPQLGFVAVLCRALAQAAVTEPGRARWLRTAAALTIAAALAPTVVLGAQQAGLLAAMAAGASVVLLLVIVLLFRYSFRPWALPEVDQTAPT